VFQEAAKRGIHRTVHSGVSETTSNIFKVGLFVQFFQICYHFEYFLKFKAVNLLKAERIGHGYRIVQNEQLYRECISKGIHFECCPTVQNFIKIQTVNQQGRKVSPILRMAQDGASFSINSDNPSIFNVTLKENYKLAAESGLTQAQLQQSVSYYSFYLNENLIFYFFPSL